MEQNNTLASVMFGIGIDSLRHTVSPEEMEDFARDAMREENAPPSNEDLEALAREFPVHTFADTARVMAQIMPDYDWDAWKDEMKERDI